MFSARESVQNMGERLEGSWVSGNGSSHIGGGKKIQRIQCAEIRHKREITLPRRVEKLEKLREVFPAGVT